MCTNYTEKFKLKTLNFLISFSYDFRIDSEYDSNENFTGYHTKNEMYQNVQFISIVIL